MEPTTLTPSDLCHLCGAEGDIYHRGHPLCAPCTLHQLEVERGDRQRRALAEHRYTGEAAQS
jgi:hypothetical protein